MMGWLVLGFLLACMAFSVGCILWPAPRRWWRRLRLWRKTDIQRVSKGERFYYRGGKLFPRFWLGPKVPGEVPDNLKKSKGLFDPWTRSAWRLMTWRGR